MIRFLCVFLFCSGLSISARTQDKYVSGPDWHKTYDVKFYFLNLDVNDTSTYIKGNTVVKVEIKEQTDSLVFDFNPSLIIDSVFVNSEKNASYEFQSELLVITLQNKMPVSSFQEVIIYYHGNVSTNVFFSSFTNEYESNWKIPVTWTLSEPFGARYWFPCKQQLTDKADSCWVFLTIPRVEKQVQSDCSLIR
ncbi:MAG: M1 family metallopeptidase [Chloroflexia bacterium]|nr:M1 family metallopeptidase [Chloroflexia bacterium]